MCIRSVDMGRMHAVLNKDTYTYIHIHHKVKMSCNDPKCLSSSVFGNVDRSFCNNFLKCYSNLQDRHFGNVIFYKNVTFASIVIDNLQERYFCQYCKLQDRHFGNVVINYKMDSSAIL